MSNRSASASPPDDNRQRDTATAPGCEGELDVDDVITISQCEHAADLFRALANPTRVAIIMHLTEYSPLCVHDLVALLDLPQPMVSQHLKVLRDAGLVHRGRRGREAAYSLVDEHVAHIVGDAVIHTSEPEC